MLEDLDIHAASEPDRVIPPPASLSGNTLATLDLEKELYNSYSTAKTLYSTIEYEDDIPANQKAQVMNTISGILKDIVKTRTELYNAERVKAMEGALIYTLKTLPAEAQDAFFKEYEQALARV